jgi:integrase
MARGFKFYHTLGEGEKAIKVGYGFVVRGEFLAVTFKPPGAVRLVEKMTGSKLRGQSPDQQFHTDVARILVGAYSKSLPTLKKATWEDALEETIRTSNARPDTVSAYRSAVLAYRQFLPEVQSPSDLTPELAQRFGRLLLTTPYTRGKSKVQRKRSPVTLSFYVRTGSALWKHFKELGYVKVNPWGEVTVPKAEKKQKYVPTEEDINHFFEYVHKRYPKWERFHALLMVKLISACRTADLVQLRTEQIQNGQLVFLASQTKTKADRAVPLPEDLCATLERIGGKVHLWDGWNEDLRTFRPSKNAIPTTFKADTVQCVVENIFQEYSDSHPDRPRMTPHDFRRRAITHMVKALGSVDKAANALGITAACAKAHYLDAQQAFDVKEAFRLSIPGILPRTIPVLNPNNSEQTGTKANI